jgi:D-glycero-alpha-D-manno-heptose-7-phosphate kinase
MVITRTPFRMSFFGGGTDYHQWYSKYGGSVLATSIDKYCYITCRKLPPFFDHKHRIIYSKIETVKNNFQIQHPVVKAVLDWSNQKDGLEIHHDGDLPARSGLGSSSSFTVGLIHALNSLNGNYSNSKFLSQNAIHIERDVLRENVGSQDQISAAYGGFNLIKFSTDGSFDVDPVNISYSRKKDLEDSLMLFFTGVSRYSSDIAKSTIANIDKQKEKFITLNQMVNEALEILTNEEVSLDKFGELLNKSWEYKKSISNKISTKKIDKIYNSAIESGAIGGKILGAGGGGFIVFYVPKKFQVALRNKLNDLVYVPFKFENTGSTTVLNQPNGFN